MEGVKYVRWGHLVQIKVLQNAFRVLLVNLVHKKVFNNVLTVIVIHLQMSKDNIVVLHVQIVKPANIKYRLALQRKIRNAKIVMKYHIVLTRRHVLLLVLVNVVSVYLNII